MNKLLEAYERAERAIEAKKLVESLKHAGYCATCDKAECLHIGEYRRANASSKSELAPPKPSKERNNRED